MGCGPGQPVESATWVFETIVVAHRPSEKHGEQSSMGLLGVDVVVAYQDGLNVGDRETLE
jgi:hypothetical protein